MSTVYVSSEQFEQITQLMAECFELREQSKNQLLTLAEKLDLIQRSNEARTRALAIGRA